MNWNDFFYYDGVNLRWASKRRRIKVGDVAGYLRPDGYRIVRLNGVNILVHRIVWQIHNGYIDSSIFIDHINHDRDDNRIENLRAVTKRENARNCSKRVDNSSGVTGVYFEKRLNLWYSRIVDDKGSFIHLCYFHDINDAIDARMKASIKFNYHQNHGA